MDPRPRKNDQVVPFEGRQMPSGSAVDRLCDLGDCHRPSEVLMAAADGSILLVCTSCATTMTEPPVVPEEPSVSGEPAPIAVPATEPSRRDWWAWVRCVLGVVLLGWGLWICSGNDEVFDGVVTAAVGGYLLLNLIRPRYRN